MSKIPWHHRSADAVTHPVDLSPYEIWVVFSLLGEADSLRSWLGLYRWHSFVASTADSGCRTCGSTLPEGSRSDARYCSSSCQGKGYRSNKSGRKTVHEKRVRASEIAVSTMRAQVRQLLAKHESSYGTAGFMVPPNLLDVLSSPILGCCGSIDRCNHTGSVCMLAATAPR